MRISKKYLVIFLILPMSTFFISHIIPLFYGLQSSLQDREGNWVGFEQYQEAAQDENFWGSITFTFIYAGSVTAVSVFFGLLIGAFLNEIERYQWLFKTCLIIPWAIAFAVWGLEMRIMLARDFGVLNHIGHGVLGIFPTKFTWTGDPFLAKISLILASSWRVVPFAGLLFLVGCQMIPKEIYESAEIAGVNAWQKFRYITLPLLRNIILFVGILAFITTLQEFGLVYALTFGGPGYATHTAAFYIWRQALGFLNFEYGTALSFIWLTISFAIVALIFKVAGRFR